MFRMLGAAVAAVVLSCAGSAGAAPTVLAQGVVTGNDYGGYDLATFGPGASTWDVTFWSDKPIRNVEYEFFAKKHFHYEYDNPLYSYGAKFDVDLPFTVTPISGGFTYRFTVPSDRSYRFDDPEFGYDYWEVWQPYLMLVARMETDGGSAAYKVTYSAAPEPATWAMLIAGFGLAGAALRSRRRAAYTFQ